MTSAQRNENRLTDDDRDTIQARITETLKTWRLTTPHPLEPSAIEATTLYRIACHAIGCSDADLRTSEVDEIEAMVADLLDNHTA